jgi:hypothetical protein
MVRSPTIKNFSAIGARIVMFVQDTTKIDQALKLNDPKIKVGRNYFPISVNMKEPYQLEKKFRQAMQTLGGQVDILMLCHGYIKNESKFFGYSFICRYFRDEYA